MAEQKIRVSTFGERLKQLRKERKMSLDAVADRIGVTRPTVYRYENGNIINVPPDKVHQLANLFGVTRPYLMGWTEEREVNPDRNLDVVAEMMRTSVYREPTDQSAKWSALAESDCTTAAAQALRALIKFKIGRTPIYPQQILQASQLATLITYADPVEPEGTDRKLVVSSMRTDADGKPHYIFAANRNAPIGELSLQLCIHIGHIYLGHAGDQNHCARRHEAECFAVHLKFPRPLIRTLLDRGYVFTKESFSRVFGYCEPCLDSMLAAHPVTVPPELNRLAREQFGPYVTMLEEAGALERRITDGQEALDFGKYMAGYEE